MPLRNVFWTVGLVSGAVVAAAVDVERSPALRLFAVVGLTLAFGLAGEAIVFVRSRSRPSRRPVPSDRRPADGVVDVVAIPGVRSEPNPADPRFGRYLDRDDPTPGPVPMATDRRTPPLLGRVVIVSLFVGRDGRPWTDEEIARAHRAFLRAGAWVENEARRWVAAVNVELAETYFVYDDPTPDEVVIEFYGAHGSVDSMEKNAGFKALAGLSRAALSLGFHDAMTMLAEVEGRLDADTVVWLIHPRRVGRSFAVPRDHEEWGGLDVAVCYVSLTSYPGPLRGPAGADPVTVVHELMHLFGATDKYGRPLRDFPGNSVTSRDVMRLDEVRLTRIRVDPRTASEIGWVRAGTRSKRKRPPET